MYNVCTERRNQKECRRSSIIFWNLSRSTQIMADKKKFHVNILCCLRQAIFIINNDFIIFIFTLSFTVQRAYFIRSFIVFVVQFFERFKMLFMWKKYATYCNNYLRFFRFSVLNKGKILYETYRFVIELFRYIPRRIDSWKTFDFQLCQKSLWKILTSILSTKVLNQIKPIHSFAEQLHGFWENSTETVVVEKVFLETHPDYWGRVKRGREDAIYRYSDRSTESSPASYARNPYTIARRAVGIDIYTHLVHRERGLPVSHSNSTDDAAAAAVAYGHGDIGRGASTARRGQ